MMKALKALVASNRNAQVGNHAVKYLDDVMTTCYYTGRGHGFTREFHYHENTICLVDDVNRLVILTHAGWNTSSTSRAINDYRHYFVDECGYTEVDA